MEVGKNRGGRNGDTSDKIVKVFALLLLVFALCLIGSGVISLVKNKKSEEDASSKAPEKQYIATIETEVDEENEKVNIVVDNEIAIQRVIYKWNSNSEITIEGDGTNHLEKTIDLVVGKSTLNIQVIDIKGNETTKSFEISSSTGKDIISPRIELVVQGSKLLITAEDETELAYITYRWNDGETITVRVDEDADDKTKLTEEVDILMGSNTITIVAVDTSNNTKVEPKPLVGVTKPEIVVNLIGEGNVLEITCKHEKGIKEIYYTLNDRPYQYIAPEGETHPEIKFTQDLDIGYNRIKLKVTSVDDIPAEFDGECEYYPEGSTEDTTEDSANETDVDGEEISDTETEDEESTDTETEDTTDEATEDESLETEEN